jgi:hypothetical protein
MEEKPADAAFVPESQPAAEPVSVGPGAFIPTAAPLVITIPEPVEVKRPPESGACPHCGRNPIQPTRDGIHTDQCRMELVKRTEDLNT